MLNPDTLPVKSPELSSLSVPLAAWAKLTSSDTSPANSSVADPLINADPVPLTAPSTVTFPPFAQINPEFAMSE